MATITLNREEKTEIPFTIVDPANGLSGKRVTWAVSDAIKSGDSYVMKPPGYRVLRKVGGLPGSTSDITISSQTSGTITGTINILFADYVMLPADAYVASLWIDDGADGNRCVSVDDYDVVIIDRPVSRLP
jgi:hypothetical protein